MDALMIDELLRQKQQIRVEALSRRDNLMDGEARSRRIFQRLMALPEYLLAHTVLIYLDIRSEVCTQWCLPTLWSEGKKVIVPYCEDDRLKLFHIKSLDELAPRTMQILEPRSELHELIDRHVSPGDLDLIITPGVAFDRRGDRLGYGKGYYDKLLHLVRHDAAKIAVCYECQLFPEIPVLPHDIRLDKVVTEDAVYP